MNDLIQLHDLPRLLLYIAADDRDTWIKVGMGIKAEFGEAAFDDFDSWSQSGHGYNANDCRTSWRSFTGSGITIGTVIQLAKEGGWQPDKQEMTADEKRQRKAEAEARRVKRQAEIEADEQRKTKMQQLVAEGCQTLWDQHCDAAGESQYLERKKVQGFGVRYVSRTAMLAIDDRAGRVQVLVGSDAHRWLSSMPKPRPDYLSMYVLRAGDLVFPLRDINGQLHALQSINAGGTKMFPKYGRKSGNFHVIGNLPQAAVIAVAEGYSTAASVHMSTGWPVAVALDSGNMSRVASQLASKYPAALLLIAGDDDPNKPNNPGRTAALAAAQACNGALALPTGGDVGDDWNDLHLKLGADEVSRQLQAAVESGQLPPTPSNDGGPENRAAPERGAGGGDTPEKQAERLLMRFALVEGKTDVWDGHRLAVLKKSGFEALVGKDLAKGWYDNIRKKRIDPDIARITMDRRKMQAKALRDGWAGMTPTERYVYIDGTKDIWDRAKRRRIPDGALKLMLGDSYTLWLNSDERRVVDMDHIVFDPRMTKDPAVYINTFEGLPLEPDEDHDKSKAIRSLIDFLCNGDKEAIHWLTCWLAYPLQHGGAKMDTAVLHHSTMQGSGKSLFFADIMGELYGQYAATVGQGQLESAWTSWMSGKLYAVFEEVVARDQRYNQVGRIKHMITGKTVRMESKFVNGWEEANYMNAVFLSNEIMPWPIDETDRRMFVMWPEKTLPVATQKAVGHEIKNGGVASLYSYLLSYDLGDFDERTRPPMTEARQRLVALSRAGWENFVMQWRTGLLDVPFSVCRTQDLHDLYLEWCKRNKENTLSETKFSLFVATIVPKTDSAIFWTCCRGKRRRSMLFVPDDAAAEGFSVTDLANAKLMGQHIEKWRDAAFHAGWSVDEWEKCIGWESPLGGAA
ncbi:MAG: hypothetical protein GX665_12540 [Gammaproteobacteria bacterium]|nr:hypothetical protein [Gammaproteobacteria bacterium]